VSIIIEPKIRLPTLNKNDLIAAFIVSFILAASLFFITDFLSNMKNIEGFFIITLSIILIDGTLSLLSFTYVLAIRSSPIDKMLTNSLSELEYNRLIWGSEKKLIDIIVEWSKENKNRIDKLKNSLKIVEEKVNSKEECEKCEGKNIDECPINEEVKVSRKETDLIEENTFSIQALVELYRIKLTQKSGELFFMSTIFAIMGLVLIGIYLIIIQNPVLVNLFNSINRIPSYIYIGIVLFFVIYSSIIFIRGILTILQVFKKIGLIKDSYI